MKQSVYTKFNSITNHITVFMLGGLMLLLAGCNDFLDVLPDDIANIDHAFANSQEAEKFLASLYSYAPAVHHENKRTLTFFGADDMWTYTDNDNYTKTPGIRIARGEQNASDPYENWWDGEMFKAIRDCNIFIEEMSNPARVPELNVRTRKRWIAEANFLKAYFHFLLFRMYGPIPITDKNLEVGAGIEQVAVKRDKVDDVVTYISNLIDSAAVSLPIVIENAAQEAGRITRPAAYMLKARAWATVASPLFNGNSDYLTFEDKDGVRLFPQEYDESKWQNAVKACEAALADLTAAELYTFVEGGGEISDKTQYQMNLRGAITDRFNREIIWGRFNDSYQNIVMQAESSVPQMIPETANAFQHSAFSVTLNMVERFYTKNGVPIDEDKEWNYSNRYTPVSANDDQKFNLITGYNTAYMNHDRENRFYASLMFDGAVVFMKNSVDGGVVTDRKAHPIRALFGQPNGTTGTGWTTVTGYWVRKLINWEYTHSDKGASTRFYSWPEMRLADLKLLYAEALNEVGRSEEAIKQVDEVRKRSGLTGVKDAWSKHSTRPNKPNTKEGLREIIQQEREIELAFEGHRLWDLKRWKKAEQFQNRYINGWNVVGRNPSEYYQVNKLYEQKFIAPRDYLWPISINTLLRNQNLVQNPGW